jgi:hypothetical protein
MLRLRPRFRRLVTSVPVLIALAASLTGAACGSSSHSGADASRDGSTDRPEDRGEVSASKDAASDVVTSDSGDANADAGAPIVVATFANVPASLALAGDTLYVTVAETATGADGKVVAVAKTATNATPDGGVTTLVPGLNQPRAIAAAGTQVLWADKETAFPGNADVMTVATAGGPAQEIASAATTMTRLAIAGSTLYTLTSDSEVISAVSLTATDGGAPTPVYPGNPPHATVNPDTDGTSVFFFTNGTTNLDLFQAPVGGGTATDLAMNATSGSVDFDFLVDDASSVYWSDAGTGTVFSLARTAGAKPVPLATFQTGSAPVQIVPDGTNLYLLSSQKLMRLPKAGGTTVVLASVAGSGSDTFVASLGNAVALAVDDTYVYWLYEGHGQILKIAK